MTYNVIAYDHNLNEIPLFAGIDEVALNEFFDAYCEDGKDLFDLNYRWLRDNELPEYNIPYCTSGWLIRYAVVDEVNKLEEESE